MHRSKIVCVAFVFLVAGSSLSQVVSPPQVVSPVEIDDPELSALQQQYLDDLNLAAREIAATRFDYPFYLGRKGDLDNSQPVRGAQRSLRFDKYEGKTVIAITGNYYASYSAEKVPPEQRARNTFLNVVLRVLHATVPHFQSNPHVQGYEVEVSHHVLGRAMGASMERRENLMVFLPQAAAITLLTQKDEDARQGALQKGQIFLNAVPVSVWLNATGPQSAANAPTPGVPTPGAPMNGRPRTPQASEIVPNGKDVPQSPGTSPGASPPPLRDNSAEALSSLQTSNQPLLNQIVKEMDPQAHFVAYLPPKFVAFRQGVYLELSMNTDLPASAAGSRYKLAALAFDEHIAHFIRPLLGYFRDDQKFDGIGFSTTVQLLANPAPPTSEAVAVEFFFPLTSLRCYGKYECTGQQLLDAGTVLINGERARLDLQIAEGASSH